MFIYIENNDLYYSMPISDIIIKSIDNTHFYGQYGSYKVVMMKKHNNWYLSVDEINNNIDKFNSWKNFHKDFIEYVNCEINKTNNYSKNNESAIIHITHESNNIINGIYIQEDLFPDALGYVSVDFRLKMSKIISKQL